MPPPGINKADGIEKDKTKEPNLLSKVYTYLKEKVVDYLPEQFKGYVFKVEDYLDDFFGVDKAKKFLTAAKYEKRDVGGGLYANGNTLELLGIGAEVAPEKVREAVEERLVSISFLGKNIKVNKIFAKKLNAINSRVAAAMKKAGYKPNVVLSHSWRCISPHRGKSGDKKLSNHALGLAIDIDPKRNPYRSYGKGEAVGEIGKNMEIVKIFEDAGISWGGRWQKSQDAMHFALTYEDLLNAKA